MTDIKKTKAERRVENIEKNRLLQKQRVEDIPEKLTRGEKKALRIRERAEVAAARLAAFDAANREEILPATAALRGRSVKFSFELFDQICDLVSGGATLRHACAELGICERTVRLWILDDRGGDDSVSPPVPGCATLFDRARLLQAEAWADGLIDIADACTSETAVADKVKIEVRKYLMSRNSSERFGDTSKVVHAEDEKRPLRVGAMSETLAMFVGALEHASRAKSRAPGGSSVLDLECSSSAVHS